MHFIVGEKLNYLCSVLNSKLVQWLLSLIIGEAAGGNAGNASNVLDLHVPYFDKDERVSDKNVYALYRLNEDEIAFIEKQL